jgi:MFS family permease
MASSILPVVLFGPLAGTLADRMDRKKCMLIADGARLIVVAVLYLLCAAHRLSLPLLYLLVFGAAIFVPLFEAAATSSLVNLAGTEKVAQVTALNSSVLQLSNIIGATLGGLFLAMARIEGAMLVNALTFALSFVFIWQIQTDLARSERAKKEPYFAQLCEGFVYITKDNRIIGYVLMLYALSNFFASTILLFIPVAVKTFYQQSVSWVAVLEGSMAAGFVVVSIALSFIQKGGNVFRRSFIGGWFIAGAFGLLTAGNLIFAAAGLFIMGVAIAWSGTSMQVFYQRNVRDDMKGRFFALMSALVYAGFPLTFLLNGFLMNQFPLNLLVIFNAVMVLIVNFGFLFIPKYEVLRKNESDGL